MTKEKVICLHCGTSIMWCPGWMHETNFRKIDGKIYCMDCVRKLAKFYVENSVAE